MSTARLARAIVPSEAPRAQQFLLGFALVLITTASAFDWAEVAGLPPAPPGSRIGYAFASTPRTLPWDGLRPTWWLQLAAIGTGLGLLVLARRRRRVAAVSTVLGVLVLANLLQLGSPLAEPWQLRWTGLRLQPAAGYWCAATSGVLAVIATLTTIPDFRSRASHAAGAGRTH